MARPHYSIFMSESNTISIRPPVVVVLGHVDHGKSTLLDYIRKANVVSTEAGGITQHTAAYEVVHPDQKGTTQKITFIDTPGHEAFGAQRKRGAAIADIAILVVSAEDGVKKQTIEAYQAIQSSDIPCIVAINKTDLPGADIEKTLSSLTEHGIYLEGRGGTIPYVPVSARKGDGISELLDMITLLAELQEYSAEITTPAEGVIIEAHRDPKKGISATFIIKNGSLFKGMMIATKGSLSPVRALLDFSGKQIESATVCAPITIVGWSALPSVGETVKSFKTKKEAEEYAGKHSYATHLQSAGSNTAQDEDTQTAIVPVIIKGDVVGSLDAIQHEVKKIITENVYIKILHADVGTIGEADIKRAGGDSRTIILGFNTKVDAGIQELAERSGITIKTENIIYKLSEWLQEIVTSRRPKQKMQEVHGKARVLKCFSKIKTKQIIGGRVEEGMICMGDVLSIIRRGEEIGTGKIVELQKDKKNASQIDEGSEFGAKIDTPIVCATGDMLVSSTTVEK